MPATISDFEDFDDVAIDLCVQWPIMARALQGLGAFFSAKIATGTEPNDVLHGITLGISGQSTTFADWRLLVNASNEMVVEENTGTDASPTWVTRFTLPGGTSFAADGEGIELVGSTLSLELDGSTLSKSASGLRVAALTASRALVSDGSGNLSVATTTATEIGYVNGVTSAIQTQIDGKEDTISLTASRAVVSDGGGALAVAATTATEIGYVNGVTSAIQTQLNAKVADTGDTMTGQLLVNLGTGAELTNSCIRAFGYSPAFELLDKDSVLNWHFGIDDNDSNAAVIGRGYGPGQSIAPAIRIDSSDNVLVRSAATASRAVVTDGSGNLINATTTSTEIGYVNGVTSAIQTQINGKITSGAGAIVNADVNASAAIAVSKLAALTASRAVVTDGSGFISASAATATEVGYLSGVTSGIQAQIDGISAGAGGTAVISSNTFSGASSVDLDDELADTSYDFFILLIRASPSNDDVQIRARVDSDSGASYATTGYETHLRGLRNGTDQTANASGHFTLAGSSTSTRSVGNAAAEFFSCTVYIYPGPTETKLWTTGVYGDAAAGGGTILTVGGGRCSLSAVGDSIQFYPEAGTITGEYTLLGVNNT